MAVWNLSGKKILVLGSQGLVGSALVRRLEREDCQVFAATRQDADLREPLQVQNLIETVQPDGIILAAATVGGILANRDNPVPFLENNLLIQVSVLRTAHQLNIERVLLLGSSCIYPKHAPQPLTEDSILSGPLEPTNDAYAIAKIAGLRLIDAYRQQYGRQWISAMPTNLYGPEDNFDLETAHVLPALLRKFHEAKESKQPSVTVWGTGKPRREFMHVDDCADALIYILQAYDALGPINIGMGQDTPIKTAAETMKKVVGFNGEIIHDLTKPDGTLSKLMDDSRLRALGWIPRIDLESGLKQTYQWYLNNQD